MAIGLRLKGTEGGQQRDSGGVVRDRDEALQTFLSHLELVPQLEPGDSLQGRAKVDAVVDGNHHLRFLLQGVRDRSSFRNNVCGHIEKAELREDGQDAFYDPVAQRWNGLERKHLQRMLRPHVLEPLLREVRDAARKRTPQISSQAGLLSCQFTIYKQP